MVVSRVQGVSSDGREQQEADDQRGGEAEQAGAEDDVGLGAVAERAGGGVQLLALDLGHHQGLDRGAGALEPARRPWRRRVPRGATGIRVEPAGVSWSSWRPASSSRTPTQSRATRTRAPTIRRASTSSTVPRRRADTQPTRRIGTAWPISRGYPSTVSLGESRVGVSGWTYPPWRGDFYPKGLRQREELAYAASRLTSIEINGSFYALQKPESYQKWRDETPDDFVFSVKGSRFITHMKRLADVPRRSRPSSAPASSSSAPSSGRCCGSSPRPSGTTRERLATFFGQLPPREHARRARPVRHAPGVPEPDLRPAGDLRPPARARRRLRAGRHRRPLAQGGRGHRGLPLRPAARRQGALRQRLRRRGAGRLGGPDPGVAGGGRFVYFDNDAKGYAPHDAMRLIERLG